MVGARLLGSWGGGHRGVSHGRLPLECLLPPGCPWGGLQAQPCAGLPPTLTGRGSGVGDSQGVGCTASGEPRTGPPPGG